MISTITVDVPEFHFSTRRQNGHCYETRAEKRRICLVHLDRRKRGTRRWSKEKKNQGVFFLHFVLIRQLTQNADRLVR